MIRFQQPYSLREISEMQQYLTYVLDPSRFMSDANVLYRRRCVLHNSHFSTMSDIVLVTSSSPESMTISKQKPPTSSTGASVPFGATTHSPLSRFQSDSPVHCILESHLVIRLQCPPCIRVVVTIYLDCYYSYLLDFIETRLFHLPCLS